jgi:hypothetical protein
MYFSTELGIRLSFVKTSDFRGGGGVEHPNPSYGTPLRSTPGTKTITY